MIEGAARKTISLPLELLDALAHGAVLQADDGRVLHASPAAITLLGGAGRVPAALASGAGLIDTQGGRRLRLSRHPLPDQAVTLWLLEDLTPATRAAVLRDDALRALSHDLRSPIASVLTLAEAVADSSLPATPDAFTRVAQCAEAALAQADRVLRLLRADAAEAERFECFDLQQIVWEAADECWHDAKRRQTPIEIQVPDGEALVRGDVDLLRRALTHLLHNAVLHGPAGQPVQLSLNGDGTNWRLRVSDQGPGLSAAQASVLLAAAPSAPVKGLGLAIVRRVCDRHGAQLSYRHDANGASIQIELPAAH